MSRLSPAVAPVIVLGICAPAFASPEAHPVVPGLAREEPGRGGLDAALRGLVLLEELGCTNCHAPGAHRESLERRGAADLSAVGARVHPEYLKAFIAAPRRMKPGTTMPDVLGARDQRTRAEAADALTHYLVSLTPEGFELEAPDRVAADRGAELFHSIGCVACHSPRDADGNELSTTDSAPLGRLERKYSVSTLTSFLEAPHTARPSTRMPDFYLPPGEAYQLASYLVRETRVPGPLRYTLFLDGMEDGLDRLDGKERAAGLARGFDLRGFEKYRADFALRLEGFLEISQPGEYTFVLECGDTARLRIDGAPLILLERPGRREGKARLSPGLHAIDLVYAHLRGAPALELRLSGPGIDGAPIPASMLRSEETPAEPYAPFAVDAARAERGRALFAALGCGRCHQLEPASPPETAPELPELAKLNPLGGCLSGETGSWPSYGLAPGQVEELRAALGVGEWALTPEERIRKTLVAFNCIACHERGELGGVPASRNDYYVTADPNLGETGRLPPPLTGAGAKLQRDWLRRTIAGGQSLRPYMSMRMPGFGNETAERLAELLAAQDHVPPIHVEPLPRDEKKAKEVRDTGWQLVGDGGLSCITCHTFRGEQAGTMAAVDLVETTTQRLRKDWFHHYLRQPARFRPITIMPQFFPDGVSIIQDVAGGDPERQIDAIWHYLAEGRNTRAPRGMRRPPMEIAVRDEAVMLRRSAQDTGKRAISVGYPLGVHLTFDAESVSLNQIWRGRFIDPGGVWTGQGSGAARILSRDRVRLVEGPALAELPDATAPWPTATSRELGLRFKGYELDERRRPEFLYVYGDIAIADKPVDLPDERVGGGRFERRLTLRSSGDRTIYFRAAVHPELEVADSGVVAVGRKVTIRALGGVGTGAALEPLAFRVRPSGRSKDPASEAILPVELRRGITALVLEYRWMEAPE